MLGFQMISRRVSRALMAGPMLAGLMLASLTGVSAAQAAEDPGFLRVGAGYYDINDDQDAGEFHAEFISGEKLWVFNPFIGIMATTDSAFYGYGGIRLDVFLGRRWVFTPAFAAGLYSDGDGKDLGHVVEFRSAVEIAYRFDDRSRLGLSLYHLSNASLSDSNQGTEVVTLHYSYPLDKLFD
jgi:hypothetical protein